MFGLVTLAHLIAPDELSNLCAIMVDGEISAQALEWLLRAFMARAMGLGDQGLHEVQRRRRVNPLMAEQEAIDPGPTILDPVSLGTLNRQGRIGQDHCLEIGEELNGGRR